MDKVLEILTVNILIMSLIIALIQNILVDIFKAGNNTHFQNTGVTTQGRSKLINRLLLLMSGFVVFVVLYVARLLTLQETILTCLVSTVLAWIFYRVNIYSQIMDLLFGLKNGILNLIKKKFGE